MPTAPSRARVPNGLRGSAECGDTCPALRDAQHAHPPARAGVAGYQTQPGGELASAPERGRIAHRGDRGGRRQHPDTRNRRDPPAGGILSVPHRDPPLDGVHFGVERGHSRPLLAQRLDDHCRQPLRDPLKGSRHVPPHPGSAAGHDFAVLGQQTAQAVDLGGTERHQLLAHPVERENSLLLLALHRQPS